MVPNSTVLWVLHPARTSSHDLVLLSSEILPLRPWGSLLSQCLLCLMPTLPKTPQPVVTSLYSLVQGPPEPQGLGAAPFPEQDPCGKSRASAPLTCSNTHRILLLWQLSSSTAQPQELSRQHWEGAEPHKYAPPPQLRTLTAPFQSPFGGILCGSLSLFSQEHPHTLPGYSTANALLPTKPASTAEKLPPAAASFHTPG